MVIKEVNIINFGGITNKKLKFTDGFNVLSGNNEAGKSTVLSFIRFVLYGFNGRKSELKKYEPISGEKINGSVTVAIGDAEYEISRNMGVTKSKQVSVVNKTTGETMDKSFCSDIGRNVLKIGDESFVNTLFIGQSAAKISADNSELLTKLSNLARSGDEDVSYNEILSNIENKINDLSSARRKDAVIPKLENEINGLNSYLAEAKRKKDETEEKKRELEKVKELLKNAEQERERLEKSAEVSRILSLKKRLSEEKNNISRLNAEIATATKQYEAIVPDTVFSKIDTEQEALYINEVSFSDRLEKSEKEYKKYVFSYVLCFIIGVVLAIALAFLNPVAALGGIVPFAIAGVIFAIGRGKLKEKSEILKEQENYLEHRNAFFARFGASGSEEYLTKKKKYENDTAEKKVLEEKIRLKKENLEFLMQMHTKTESEALTNYKNIDTIKISDYENVKNIDEINEKKLQCEKECNQLTERLHRLTFEISSDDGGNIISASEKLDKARFELKEAKDELEILQIFKEYLILSFEELQSNFAPALAKKSSEIFSHLTGEKHNEVLVSSDFNAKIKIGSSYEESAVLSAGTLDQLYFSVRLGIIDTIKQQDEQYPVILDDAFAFYDDTRLLYVLDFLKDYAKNTQVILASCHKREAHYLKNTANIIEL